MHGSASIDPCRCSTRLCVGEDIVTFSSKEIFCFYPFVQRSVPLHFWLDLFPEKWVTSTLSIFCHADCVLSFACTSCMCAARENELMAALSVSFCSVCPRLTPPCFDPRAEQSGQLCRSLLLLSMPTQLQAVPLSFRAPK